MASLEAMSDLQLKEYCTSLELPKLIDLSRKYLRIYLVCKDVIKTRRGKIGKLEIAG